MQHGAYAAWGCRSQFHEPTKEQLEHLSHFFELLDEDGSGYLSFRE